MVLVTSHQVIPQQLLVVDVIHHQELVHLLVLGLKIPRQVSTHLLLAEMVIILIILIMILRIYISSIQSLLFSKGNIKFVNNIQITHSIILVPLIITFSFCYIILFII